MGKGSGGRMKLNNSGNGGIMGSGIFAGFGSVIQCKSDDTSMFCTLSKIVNTISMIIFLLFVLYMLYVAYKYFTGKNNIRGGLGEPAKISGGYLLRNSKSNSKPTFTSKKKNLK